MSNARRLSLPILSVLLVAFATACGGGDTAAAAGGAGTGKAPAAAGGGAVAAQEARTLYESLCVTCHGTDGKGDGPGAAALEPKPRSFRDAAWQDAVTDEQIQKAVVYGGAAVGKSPMMPAQPQLKGKTEVLQALTGIVRGFRQ
ncbi:MAG: c-type cytochrome [Planctomycetes bacterium]|nr:c-type cytochrome [Planctomycetota bacterium]